MLFFVAFALSNCGQPSHRNFSSEPEVSIDLEQIRERGYLEALVDNNSISYFIYKGHTMGYEYELLQLFAKHLGVSLKIKITSGVERAIEMLNTGEGDILAFPLTITTARKQLVKFTRPHFNTYQVLVQRKPREWRKLSYKQLNDSLIREIPQLDGKAVHVIKGTSHALRLKHLQEELGIDIEVMEDSLSSETESLIRKVATGEIDFTVSDHMLAQVNAAYYPDIDVSTVISVPQQIAWAVRKNSPDLERAINDWLEKIKKEPTFMVIYSKYYKSPRTSAIRMQSDFSSLSGKQLSPYDDLIKEGAERLGWDWRLLASMIYQESHFSPTGESWAGARGLMQLMPATAKRYGVTDLNDPRQSVKAGVSFLKYLESYWAKKIKDPQERIKFVMASYNAGLAHIIDAYKLAEKHGKDAARWDGHVAELLLKKSDPAYYRDPVVTVGYCKCEEPVNYVTEVLHRYEQYKLHIDM